MTNVDKENSVILPVAYGEGGFGQIIVPGAVGAAREIMRKFPDLRHPKAKIKLLTANGQVNRIRLTIVDGEE